MDLLQQYLREAHDAGRLPTERDFEMFKAGPAARPRPMHLLAQHSSYRGADGQPYTIAGPALRLAPPSPTPALVVVGNEPRR